ncbi:dihydropteroate synthase [Sulfurimonas sp. SAG-AH-194-I05]|nr:dihydropteroate synthase [Sulfurimonas sp. SAG-AH-194-I05]MDF1874369.1 dihydropteroate synthase [Sulfurimonas sp. SAG-AH-194-I05]
MQIEKISSDINAKKLLTEIGVDGGGIKILASKMKTHTLYIRDLHVGAANILKQDALSIGADLAVPKGTVTATTSHVNCILIATSKQLQILSKKELAQPFGLKEVAKKLSQILKVREPSHVDIMGVLNANEDSFFEASRFNEKNAIIKIENMIEDGASIIDIGGVSSRPNAPIVSPKEELKRVAPILKLIYDRKLYEKTCFSIDSCTPNVIAKALESGFSMVNDITGLKNDTVCSLCATYNTHVVIMHMKGTPQTMQDNPQYSHVLSEVYSFLEQRIQKAESFGISDIVVDVGVGFGKSLQDNLSLIKNLEHFSTLKRKILVGASRKSMINLITPSSTEERLAGTLTLHLEALRNGASILRVHDVKEHAQAVAVYKALKNK